MEEILGRKTKSNKGKKFLNSLAPQLHEGVRNCAFLRGIKSSEASQAVMHLLYLIKKKSGINFTKKKEIKPMENQDKIKIICHKNRCPLFCFGYAFLNIPFYSDTPWFIFFSNKIKS